MQEVQDIQLPTLNKILEKYFILSFDREVMLVQEMRNWMCGSGRE